MRWRQRASRRQPSIPAPFLNKYIYITLVCIYRNGWLRRIHSIINSTWIVATVFILTRSLTMTYWNSAFPRPLLSHLSGVATWTFCAVPFLDHLMFLSSFLMDAIIVAHSVSKCIARPTPQLGTPTLTTKTFYPYTHRSWHLQAPPPSHKCDGNEALSPGQINDKYIVACHDHETRHPSKVNKWQVYCTRACIKSWLAVPSVRKSER